MREVILIPLVSEKLREGKTSGQWKNYRVEVKGVLNLLHINEYK